MKLREPLIEAQINCCYASRRINYNSRTDIRSGLRKTFDWYKNNRSFFSRTSIRQFDKRIGLKL